MLKTCARSVIPGAFLFMGAVAVPETITSRKNDLVGEYLRLSSSAAVRRDQGKIPLEGARLCRDAAASGLKVFSLFYTAEAEEKYGVYLQAARVSSPAEYLISQPVALRLSDTKSPQGVFCICAMPEGEGKIPNASKGSFVMLENIQDPANLGAVLRTAEAVGVGGVILAGNGCDVFSQKALRAGMGAVFRLPVFRCSNAAETVLELNAAGFRTLAAVPDRTALPVTEVDFSAPSVAVIGNEGNGLTHETQLACTARVTIPMAGRAESLNAAASATILMWEMMRGKGAASRDGV
jgi:TrmH family RNA methyltransferase